jgi:hypothetical protein
VDRTPREILLERLRDLTVIQIEMITDATEIYKDLAISGDDLDDLILWIHGHFGVDFSEMRIRDFAPGEGVGFRLKKYLSLTVADLLEAVENRRFRPKRLY